MLVNEMRVIQNFLLSRESYIAQQEDGQGRNFDQEFGYPSFPLTPYEYEKLWREESVAKRIVEVFPQECWSSYPELIENDKPAFTAFESKWNRLNDKIHGWHYLQRADTLSGIGRFGIMLLGVNDGEKDLSKPVAGIRYDRRKAEFVNTGTPHNVLYLRVFPENLVEITQSESDIGNVRYGHPTLYNITFADPNETNSLDEFNSDGTQRGQGGPNQKANAVRTAVHWTRVVHLADNRASSEVLGIPRMEQVGRRIYDIRKILGGSAEMFWRGAFPGYSFETHPNITDEAEIDEESVKQQFEEYAKGLKRYLALTGMSAKSLAPQVADPTGHMMQQLQMICIALGVPMRIFMGSEAGHLASAEDAVTWNRRLRARQTQYLDPLVIRPFIDHLSMLGALPKVETYSIKWNDINNASDGDKADVALKLAQTLLQYVSSGAEEILPVKFLFTKLLGWSDEETAAILAEGKKGGKLTKKVWEEPMKLSPASSGTSPTKKTGKNGRTNGLGKKK
jgi:hypothetical protein